MRRISEDFLHNSNVKDINLSAVSGREPSSLAGGYTLNLNMLPWNFLTVLVFALLGFGLAIPCNTYIVIVFLESIRKKEKLSPSDVIFLAKGIVNVLLQGFMSLQGMLFVFATKILYMRQVYAFVNTSVTFLTFCNLWMTVWLSIHYFTIITNLSYGFFVWLKGMVSNFLTQILFLTSLGLFIVSIPGFWTVKQEMIPQSFGNSTGKPLIRTRSTYSYFVPANVLGCILPFFLSLLCFVLTFSFLLRHVWKVKNNDSGSTRPNLQAHVTALRTIFFLLFMFTFFCMSQVLLLDRRSLVFARAIPVVSWAFRLSSPFVESAIIFQASKKLKRATLGRILTRSRRNADT